MKKLVVVFLILTVFITGCSVKKVEELTDSEKFAKEYNISKNNPFIYSSYKDIVTILESGTGLILLANSDDEGSIEAVNLINSEAKKLSIKEISYYNLHTLKNKEKNKYKKLERELKEDISDFDFEIPLLLSVKDGKIINYSDYFSKEEELSSEYLTKKRLKSIRKKYSEVLDYKENSKDE